MSVLASLGVPNVHVVRRARIGILATGDELVPVEDDLSQGKIRNSNGYAQAAQVAALGAIPVPLGVAQDTEQDMRLKLQAGLDLGVDMFISSAGVSVGAFDVVKAVLSEGGDVNFWRVRMRPGKPIAVGKYANVPYIGLPGNPVSSMVSFERFAKPAIRKMMGETDLAPRTVLATVQDSFQSDGRESYIRVILTQHGNETHATTTGNQGSHLITSLVKANGLLIVPEGVREVRCGEQFSAILLL
jgi:molybdopterin molybdotransferase